MIPSELELEPPHATDCPEICSLNASGNSTAFVDSDQCPPEQSLQHGAAPETAAVGN